ncbi:hypothetical protein Peur_057871 [Populus x canadensis]
MAVSDTSRRRGFGYNEESIGKIFVGVLAMMMGQTGSLVFPSQVGYELTTCSQDDGICQLVSEKELVGPCMLGFLFRCFEST